MSRGLDAGAVASGAAMDLGRLSSELEACSPQQVLHRVFAELGDRRIGLTSAFGPEGCALIDLAMRERPDVPIYTIDTGYLFRETADVREAYRERGANVVVIEPLVTIRDQSTRHGERLHDRDPDRCCAIRKVEPMRRILTMIDVWITAIRRDQSPSRVRTPIVGAAEREDGSEVVKVAPLARWTRKDTWTHLLERELPYNALLDQGYPSIGCEPCTRRPAVGETERDGRWGGRAKTECGIHSL